MKDFNRAGTLAALAFAALAGFAACDSEDPTVATSDVIGAWTGTTSQQRPLEFSVTSAGVATGVFAYQMSGQCNFTVTHELISAGQPIAVSRGEFTTGQTQIGNSASGPAFITISGEFTSSTTARGAFLIQHAPCGDTLSLSWTATKNGTPD